jgi:hypothetical protein
METREAESDIRVTRCNVGHNIGATWVVEMRSWRYREVV